jgi:hypothetical protein
MSSMEDVGRIHRKKVVRLAKYMTKKPHATENYCSASQLSPKFRFFCCGTGQFMKLLMLNYAFGSASVFSTILF